MISWLRKIDLTTVALLLGPILMVLGIVALRHQLWGHTLDEIVVLSRKHDMEMKNMFELQQKIIAGLKSQKELLRCK